MYKKTFFSLISVLFFTQCSIERSPIEYGVDNCHYCKMTIVDQQHAAQIVTKKGRNYKFDAIECMINAKPAWKDIDLHSILITDYSVPKKMIDATISYYLITENIPSPMGAFLSGFENENLRNESSKSPEDQTLSWGELQNVIRAK